ncbi:hypothetical protein MHBO_001454 [Bonamia ostreae]
MDYSTKALEEAVAKEKNIFEFLSNAEAFIRDKTNLSEFKQNWESEDRNFNDQILKTQKSVHLSFCDNFDYPKAMHSIFSLIGLTNKYISENPKTAKALLTRKSLFFVERILLILGVLDNKDSYREPKNGEDKMAEKAMTNLANLRNEIRSICINKNGDVGLELRNFRNRTIEIFDKFLNNGRLFDSEINFLNGKNECEKPLLKMKEMCFDSTNRKIFEISQDFEDQISGEKERNFKNLFRIIDKVRDGPLIKLGIKLEDSLIDGKQKCVWKRMNKDILINQINQKKKSGKNNK